MSSMEKGGKTYSQICGLLSRPETMQLFGLAEIPTEDTIRRQVTRRLAAEEATVDEEAAALAIAAVRREVWTREIKGHLGEVRGLIEAWRQTFVVRYIEDISWAAPDPFREIESSLLFPALEGHLPARELWSDYKSFRDATHKYLEKAAHLRQWAREQGPVRTDLPLNNEVGGLGVTDSYGNTAFELAARIAEGRIKALKQEDIDKLYEWDALPGRGLSRLTVAGRVVLHAKDRAKKYEEDHMNLTRELSKSRSMRLLIALRQKRHRQGSNEALTKLAERLLTATKLALLKREYSRHRCDLCPTV